MGMSQARGTQHTQWQAQPRRDDKYCSANPHSIAAEGIRQSNQDPRHDQAPHRGQDDRIAQECRGSDRRNP